MMRVLTTLLLLALLAPLPPALAVQIDAGTLRIESEYVPPQTKPNVEHLFPVPLVQAIEDWGRARLVPAGGKGTVWLIIRDASVVETPLNPSSSLFTKKPEFRFDGKIAIDIEIRNAAGAVAGRVNASVTATRELLQGASDADARRLWTEMTKAMIDVLDREAEKALRTHAAHLVR